MYEEGSDAADVRFFPPGVPLLVILLGVSLQWVWPLHPGYMLPSPVRIFVGGAIAIGSFLGLGGWVLQRFAIKPEEEYLEAKFGEAYLAYKRRVRRWI